MTIHHLHTNTPPGHGLQVDPLPGEPRTELGYAHRFIHAFGDQLRFVATWAHGHQWLVWDGRRWSPDTTGQTKRWMKGVARAVTSVALTITNEDRRKHARLVLIDLCGRNGLRPAEARALRWVDVDLVGGELSVRGQQSRSNKRTKTKRAHNAARTIRLDDETVERLRTFKAEQAVIREQAGPLWTPHGLVATTATGTPIDRRSLARSIRSLCIRAGIEDPVTPYELRHTAISHQADNGRTPWEIADWAGTSEEMISRVYRHRLRRVAPLQPATERES